MRKLKASKQAAVSLGLLAALGMAPSPLQAPTLELFSRKATTVLTNVPGPAEPLYLAGSPIKELMFWVPQNGTIGMGISIMSYAGQVFSGLIADRNLIPRPTEVMALFEQEFSDLLHLALILGPTIHDFSGESIDDIHQWIDGVMGR
jgi:diacylglycerol O-acyltransferase